MTMVGDRNKDNDNQKSTGKNNNDTVQKGSRKGRLSDKYKSDKKGLNYKHNKKPRKAINMKKVIIAAMLITIAVFTGADMAQQASPSKVDIKYTELLEMIEKGEVESVTVYNASDTIAVEKTDGEKLTAPNPKNDEYRKELMLTGVNVKVASQTPYDAFMNAIISLPLTLLILAIIYVLVNTFSSVTKNYMQTATVQDGVKFDAVAGLSEVKEELKFAIDFLRKPKAYRDCGIRVPKGMLMVGPPGTGKTLLAKAVAGEAGVPFIHTSGSDFQEMYAGLGAKRVRDLFTFARTNAPCVIFIDEIDSLGARRSVSGSDLSRDNNQTLNALLKEMDGIGSALGIFVMAATNTPDVLDKALTRPGRFDRQVFVGPPSNKDDRVEIIDVHLNGKLVEPGVTPTTISKKMVGFTGAEIEVTLNEAGIHSLMEGREGVISLEDIDYAVERLVTKGLKKKVVKNDELMRVAIHESGHALLNLLYGRKVSKVTIVPTTSGVGGFTMPDMEQLESASIKTSDDIENDIKILYGGLCAEEVYFNNHSDGCGNDIKVASEKILNYCTKLGMGGVYVDVSNVDKSYVAERMNDVAIELKNKALKDLRDNKDLLIKLANKLYDNETLSINSIDEI